MGPAGDYQDAKDMFKRNRFDRTLEFTDGLATASPPTKFTERARVLRVVVFSGQLKSAQGLADAQSLLRAGRTRVRRRRLRWALLNGTCQGNFRNDLGRALSLRASEAE